MNEQKHKKETFDGVMLLKAISGQDEKDVIYAANSIESFVKENANHITYTQLRTIHKEIKEAPDKISLLKKLHLLAYFEGRQLKEGARHFVRNIRNTIMEGLKSNEISIDTIHDYIDAIVAYHKLYGKNN